VVIAKELLNRVQAEFREMPGLRITKKQLERLCGLERLLCQAILDALVDDGFLCANSDGTYARPSDQRVARGPGQAVTMDAKPHNTCPVCRSQIAHTPDANGLPREDRIYRCAVCHLAMTFDTNLSTMRPVTNADDNRKNTRQVA
jgi:hypothetical protein